jgi:hypothetical protein
MNICIRFDPIIKIVFVINFCVKSGFVVHQPSKFSFFLYRPCLVCDFKINLNSMYVK